jgi:hypothetical protein
MKQRFLGKTELTGLFLCWLLTICQVRFAYLELELCILMHLKGSVEAAATQLMLGRRATGIVKLYTASTAASL